MGIAKTVLDNQSAGEKAIQLAKELESATDFMASADGPSMYITKQFRGLSMAEDCLKLLESSPGLSDVERGGMEALQQSLQRFKAQCPEHSAFNDFKEFVDKQMLEGQDGKTGDDVSFLLSHHDISGFWGELSRAYFAGPLF